MVESLELIRNVSRDLTLRGMPFEESYEVHLRMINRFWEDDLHKEHPEMNGELTFKYAIDEWIKRDFHRRFAFYYRNFVYRLFPDAEFVDYKLITFKTYKGSIGKNG